MTHSCFPVFSWLLMSVPTSFFIPFICLVPLMASCRKRLRSLFIYKCSVRNYFSLNLWFFVPAISQSTIIPEDEVQTVWAHCPHKWTGNGHLLKLTSTSWWALHTEKKGKELNVDTNVKMQNDFLWRPVQGAQPIRSPQVGEWHKKREKE